MRTTSIIALLVVASLVAGLTGFTLGQVAAPVVYKPGYSPPEKVRAAWIYIGPVGDAGWSYMHDVARRYVAALFSDWLETTYIESVPEDQLIARIDELVAQGYNVIFTTSFEYMDKTIEAARKYPNVMFFHCSGYKRAPNVGTYFADLYQVYYLNGLIAGALTRTGRIGYIAAFLIPEVVRHINAFAIGAREVGEQLGKNITVHVIEIGAWYSPDKARQAAETLRTVFNVDVLAFTEDSTAIVEYAEANNIYVFSHYGPMLKYGPNYVVSGQLVRWEVIYADILLKVKAGIYRPDNLDKVDYWYLLNTGAVELGADVAENGSIIAVNPRYINLLRSIEVRDKLTGEKLSVYDLVLKRYWEMKGAYATLPFQGVSIAHVYENVTSISLNWGGRIGVKPYLIAPVFDPFTGPFEAYCIFPPDAAVSSYCKGRAAGTVVSFPSGYRASHQDLWTMDYFLPWVIKH
ncbi:MAG: BMP family ABC transporter substrate-binding protein [Desulfurococcus sp.]|nr:BMP family ABC transporter substrate-binding protein [Desulfurococcus sp.]